MKIADIEGIGPVWAKKLSDAGVKTTDALLKNGGTKKARQTLADKTGLAHAQILRVGQSRRPVPHQGRRLGVFRPARACRCGHRGRAGQPQRGRT